MRELLEDAAERALHYLEALPARRVRTGGAHPATNEKPALGDRAGFILGTSAQFAAAIALRTSMGASTPVLNASSARPVVSNL